MAESIIYVQRYLTGADHLRDVFVKAMGLSDKDIVVLSGGHTLVYVACSLKFLIFFPVKCGFLFPYKNKNCSLHDFY